MNTFFYNVTQGLSEQAPTLERTKEHTFFMPTQRVLDEEIHNTQTPEQASAIIERRMAKAIEEEFSRLALLI